MSCVFPLSSVISLSSRNLPPVRKYAPKPTTPKTTQQTAPSLTSWRKACFSTTSITGAEHHTNLHNNTQSRWPLWDCLTLPPLVCVFRIVDNMPVTWCYDVEEEQKFCNPGFPIGCYVTETRQPKDACVVNVSSLYLDINMELLALNNNSFLIEPRWQSRFLILFFLCSETPKVKTNSIIVKSNLKKKMKKMATQTPS